MIPFPDAHPANVAAADLAFGAADRLLVLAPHPDDETLVTGELLQHALAAGAGVRVVIATDGDDNPWPQRWLERRWRIDAGARRRWGRRRREESLAALDVLGVPRAAVRHLGWPDGSLTDRLLDNADAGHALAAEIAAFAPTHVAMPVLDDRHPDHSALRVLAELVWASGQAAPVQVLGFVVHACGRAAPPARTCVDPGTPLARKLEALGQHGSQLALSGRRMRGIALREERFLTRLPVLQASSGSFLLPLRGLRLRARELLLVAVIDARVWRGRLPLPQSNSIHALACAEAPGTVVEVRLVRGRGGVEIDFGGTRPALVHAKLHRRGARTLIFDDDGWHAVAFHREGR